MKNYIKEAIVVTVFIIITTLNKMEIPFSGIIAVIAYPLVLGFLIYFHIKRNGSKSEIFTSILELFYKMFFITALPFAANNYPGEYHLYIAAIVIALLCIGFSFFMLENYGSKIICAIIYINLFNKLLLNYTAN